MISRARLISSQCMHGLRTQHAHVHADRRCKRWKSNTIISPAAEAASPERQALSSITSSNTSTACTAEDDSTNTTSITAKKDSLPFGFSSILAAIVDPSATSAAPATSTALSADPLWNHFWETVISTAVPSLTISCVGLSAWLIYRATSAASNSSASDKSKQKNKDSKNNPKKHNPAADLYDDLYVDDAPSSQKRKSPAQEVAEALRDFMATPKAKSKKTIRRRNKGLPAQDYFVMKNWNQILDSYQFSMVAATSSKATAAAQLRSKNFDRALGRALTTITTVPDNNSSNDPNKASLSANAKRQLLELEQDFLKQGSELLEDINAIQTQMAQTVMEQAMEDMGVHDSEMDPPPSSSVSVSATTEEATPEDKDNDGKSKNKSSTIKDDKKTQDDEKLLTELASLQKQLLQLELDFIKDVISTLGTQYASGIKAALLGDVSVRGMGGLLTQLKERPLTTILGAIPQKESEEKDDNDPLAETLAAPTTTFTRTPNLFVTRFSGDTRASQVAKLREEVTAIVRNAQPGIDEVLVVLESGGGTVTGYGLAAGQLQRLKDHGLKLTIAVEQVAASGGYMMCCVANRIVGSPFAVFGSIGVLTEVPNVYNRLKTEGVEWQTVTAGKYKRTITPFKEITDEDYDKTKEQLEGILHLFKGYVQENRPQLAAKMDNEVATGEIWFGTDAVEMGLCDEIMTADQVVTDYVDSGWNVLELEYRPPRPSLGRLGQVFGHSDNNSDLATNGGQGGIERGVRWLVRVVANEILGKAADGASHNKLDRFAARSDHAGQFKA